MREKKIGKKLRRLKARGRARRHGRRKCENNQTGPEKVRTTKSPSPLVERKKAKVGLFVFLLTSASGFGCERGGPPLKAQIGELA